jgi:hypothetical protein
VCTWPDTLCRKGYLPYVRRDATPTPRPTNTLPPLPTHTPEPEVVCQNVILDAGFEYEVHPWLEIVFDNPGNARVTGKTLTTTPYEGVKMGEVWPDNPGWGAMASASWRVPPADKLVSARLSYEWFGHSLDDVAGSDAILVILEDPADRASDATSTVVASYFNQDTVFNWRLPSFDVAPAFRKGIPRMEIAFVAKNDSLDSTWWHLDAVLLDLCTKGPFSPIGRAGGPIKVDPALAARFDWLAGQ